MCMSTTLIYLFLISLLKSQPELLGSSCVLIFVSVTTANKDLHAKLGPWLQIKFHYISVMSSVITAQFYNLCLGGTPVTK